MSPAESIPHEPSGSFSMGALRRKAQRVKPDACVAERIHKREQSASDSEIGWYRDSHRPLSRGDVFYSERKPDGKEGEYQYHER